MPRSRLVMIGWAMVLLVCGLMFCPAWGQEQLITVTGKLIHVAAIGGETTGWAVRAEQPVQIEGKTLTKLEVDPAGTKVDGLDNKRVEIRGNLEKRAGVERQAYWVLVVKEIRALPPGK